MKGKYKTLLDSLPLVAEMIGRTHGIRVIIGKMDTPCRIGKAEIHLPALDPDDEKTLVFARGWLDHEVGHVKHTVPNLKKEAKSEFQASLYNIVEDVRIENLMSQEYRGCRKNLDTSWATGSLSDEQKAKGAICLADEALPEWHPRAILEAHIVQRGRAKVIGQSKPLATTAKTELVIRQVFGDNFTDGLNPLLDENASIKDSHEALDLAKRIEAYIIKQAGAPPPPMPGSDSNESGEGGDECGSSDGEGGDSTESPSGSQTGSGQRSKKCKQSGAKDPADGGDSDDSDTSPSSAAGTNQAGDGQSGTGKRSKKRKSAGQKEGRGTQPAENSSSGQEPGESGVGGKGASMPGNQAAQDAIDTPGDIKSPWDIIEEILTQASKEALENGTAIADGGQGGGSDYAEAKLRGQPIDAKEVYGKTAALRGRMAGLLQAMTMKRRLPTKRGHRMLTRKLAGVPLGDTRIFAKHQQVKDTDTLVTLLVDRSGSMSNRIVLAMQAALGVCTGLSEIRGVKTACFAFPGQSETDPVIPMVRFGESVRLTAHKFIPHATGGTPMANALWHVARAMALEKQPRKIVMVVTDGAPDAHAATENIIGKLVQAGIEVMGIGIGINVSKLFKINRTINSIDDLGHAMFAMLTEAMIKFERKEAA